MRVLGVSWTWYAEGYDPNTGKRQLYYYSDGTQPGTAGTDCQPVVVMSIKNGSTTYGPYDDDGFSPVKDPSTGQPPLMTDPLNVKYVAQIRLDNADLSTILLATPVVDDVTVYWDDARYHLLSYLFDNRTF